MEVAARAAGVDDSRAGRRDGRPGPPRAQRAEAGRVGSGRGGGAGDALTRSSVLSRFLRRNSVTHWLKQRSTSRLYIRRLSRVCIPSIMLIISSSLTVPEPSWSKTLNADFSASSGAALFIL